MARKSNDEPHEQIDGLPLGLPPWIGAYKPDFMPSVTPIPLKDGRVQMTFMIPVYRGETREECQITLILDPKDVPKLGLAHRAELGFELSKKLRQAALTQLAETYPPPLKRKRRNALLKQVASAKAKWIHPAIKIMFRNPDQQSEKFRQMLQEVETSLGFAPTDSREVTAWLIERMYGLEWYLFSPRELSRPTTLTPNKFGKDYLYTKPHMLPCTPDRLSDLAYKIELILHGILST